MKFSNSVYKVQAAIIAIFISFFISSTGWATTYYVDSRDGKDSNIGTLETSPWRTIAKVNSSIFQPGDAILFKRGEIWREQLRVPSPGTQDKPIIFGVYGSGNKPIITAKDSIAGWSIAEKWINYSGNVWYTRCDIDPKRIWLSATEYRKAQTLSHIDSTSRWYYDSGRHQLYVYAASNPALFYSNVEGATVRDAAVLVKGKDHITFQNLDLRGGTSASVLLYGSDYFTIEDSAIGRDSGDYGLFVTNNYPTKTGSNYGIIRRCTIDSGHRLKYDYEYYAVWDGVFLINGASFWKIYDNTIQDWGHSAVLIESQNSGYKSSYNDVYSNIMTAKNVAYMRGFAVDGPEGTAQYNKIHHNLIKDTTVRNQINGDHNFIYYNIVDTITNVPYRTGATAHAFSLEGYGGYACHDNQIFNSVIYNTDEPGILVAGYAGASDKKNNSIKNNVIFNTGKNSKEGFTGYGLIVNHHSTVKDNIYQNNDFYKSGAAIVISYRGTPKTVAGFNSENGKYDTINNNIQFNPLFVDPLNSNFKLQAQSLCIDAGLATGVSKDYAGQPVPRGAGVDVGAFEY